MNFLEIECVSGGFSRQAAASRREQPRIESSSEELPGLALQPVVFAVSPQCHMFEADFLEAVALAGALACTTDELLVHKTCRQKPTSGFQPQ